MQPGASAARRLGESGGTGRDTSSAALQGDGHTVQVRTPLVSVIIPAFNVGSYVAETLNSVLDQSHATREIIVVDDGSTDDTPQRVEAYRPAIRYIRQANAGDGAARNTGLAVASGDYIAFLDADDLWVPQTLEVQLGVAARQPESGLIACDGVMFDGDTILSDRLLRGPLARRVPPEGELTGHFYRDLVLDNTITSPSQTLIPRAVVEHVGPVSTDNRSTDWEYHLRIASTYPITLHARQLVRYRYRATSAAGPLELRRFRWTLRNIPVLRQQLRSCASADRPFVLQRLKRQTRRQARAAYHYGRTHDLRYARSYLLQLCRRAPPDPVLLGWLFALWLPETVSGRLLRWVEPLRTKPTGAHTSPGRSA